MIQANTSILKCYSDKIRILFSGERTSQALHIQTVNLLFVQLCLRKVSLEFWITNA